MLTFIGYAAIASAFLWVCWQVAGAHADYHERGDALAEAEELTDCLIAEVRDLSYEKGELQWDNRELKKDIRRLRDENDRLRREATDANAAMNTSRN